MKLFLDTSVVLAACGRSTGASRLVFELAPRLGWTLHTSSYVFSEVEANLRVLGPEACEAWRQLAPLLISVRDIVSFDWPALAVPAKDRPILFTAIAWSDALLTLDRRDFSGLLGATFYGLPILTPGDFLKLQRESGLQI